MRATWSGGRLPAVDAACHRCRSIREWLARGRAAAILAGAYELSSNRLDESGAFGGQGWIIDPAGEVLAITNREQPVVTMDLDLRIADTAKTGFRHGS
jgi:N-carbamoylputrescine amidase